MKVGDLVSFYSKFFAAAAKDYANPGLIIDTDNTHRHPRYTVMWADGRITKEHDGYLKKR